MTRRFPINDPWDDEDPNGSGAPRFRRTLRGRGTDGWDEDDDVDDVDDVDEIDEADPDDDGDADEEDYDDFVKREFGDGADDGKSLWYVTAWFVLAVLILPLVLMLLQSFKR